MKVERKTMETILKNKNNHLEESLEYTLHDKILNLPSKLTFHNIEGKNLVIAPNNPSWLVLSDPELLLLHNMKDGLSIYDALMHMIDQCKLSFNEGLDIVHNFLQKISDKEFFEDAKRNYIRPSKQILIHLTNLCNLTCEQCYVDSGKALENELKTEEILDLITDIAKWNPGCIVTFSGGEPLLRKDIIIILKTAKSLGLRITLKTNGLLFNSLARTQEVMQYIDTVDISLDGATAKVNDKIRGDGAFQRILQAIEYLKSLNREFNLIFTLMKVNIEDLQENIVTFYRSLNTDLVSIHFNELFMQGRANSTHYMSKSKFYEISDNLHEQLSEAGYLTVAQESNNLKQNCSFGYAGIIKPDGNVYPCNSFSHVIGNVRDNNIQAIMNKMHSLNAATTVDKIEECRVCDLKYICAGGCKVRNYIENKDFNIVSCTDDYKHSFYTLLAAND